MINHLFHQSENVYDIIHLIECINGLLKKFSCHNVKKLMMLCLVGWSNDHTSLLIYMWATCFGMMQSTSLALIVVRKLSVYVLQSWRIYMPAGSLYWGNSRPIACVAYYITRIWLKWTHDPIAYHISFLFFFNMLSTLCCFEFLLGKACRSKLGWWLLIKSFYKTSFYCQKLQA